MIYKLPPIEISPQLFLAAKAIQEQNHDVDTPKRFDKTQMNDTSQIWHKDFKKQIGECLCEHHADSLDSVMISCPEGVKAHVDMLDEDEYEETTILTPVILPDDPVKFAVFYEVDEKKSDFVFKSEASIHLQVGIPCVFNHTHKHSLTLEKTPAHCVLIMSAMKRHSHAA